MSDGRIADARAGRRHSCRDARLRIHFRENREVPLGGARLSSRASENAALPLRCGSRSVMLDELGLQRRRRGCVGAAILCATDIAGFGGGRGGGRFCAAGG